jgi:hypothetical protein
VNNQDATEPGQRRGLIPELTASTGSRASAATWGPILTPVPFIGRALRAHQEGREGG